MPGQLIRAIDRVNRQAGRACGWALLAMVLIQFAVIVLRHVFAIGFVAMQESVWALNGLVIMGAAGYTLLGDGHVRIDVLYGSAGGRPRALVDLLGACLAILPMCVLVMWLSADYIAASWAVLEGSREAGGLPGVFVLKSAIWLFALLLALQGIAMAVRAAHVLCGHGDGPRKRPR